jgi:cob(I)alamin adenosyltransferase
LGHGFVWDQDIAPHYREVLIEVQKNLFIAEALIARDPEKPSRDLPSLSDEDIEMLEKEIDAMNEQLPVLTNFLLPGGHPIVSLCHVARTVCRRAERSLIRLNQSSPVEDIIIRLMNRLSDYLFVLARKTGKDAGADETPWITKK